VELTAPQPRPSAHAVARLSARDVVKRFGGLAAVDGVSFDLRAGEILGLIGPNGAGKTTLFDCLAGSQTPTAGTISLGETRIDTLAPHRRIGAGLARTFQIPRPFPELSVLDNVLLGRQRQAGERILPNWLTPGRVRREEKDARQKARALIDFVSLSRLADAPARTLSGGQRKLLELARVLMADPSVILLDEPAAGVNPSLLETIIERIVELNRDGMTFLLIEHNMDMVTRLCGRVIVMAAGKVICEGTPEAVSRDAAVVDAYLGGIAA
jgi:branched-chain amino acid transport system ATP-binding protein